MNKKERELLLGLTGLYQDIDKSDLELLSQRQKRNIKEFKRSENNVGRSITIQSLFENYKKFDDKYPNLDEETVKLIIERYEIIDLLENGKLKLATIRGGSLLHSLLRNKLNKPDIKFKNANEKAFSDNIISKKECKSLEFVREVRNDVAHSYWTDTDLDITYYHTAVYCILVSLYIEIESRIKDKELLEKILPSALDETNSQSSEDGLDTVLQDIETELGHKYSENGWNI